MEDPLWALFSLIFAKLDGSALARASCVSKGWHDVGLQEQLWEALCLQHWPSLSSPQGKTLLLLQGAGSFKKFYALRARARVQHAKGFLGSSQQIPPSLSLNELFFLLDISHRGVPVSSSVVAGDGLLRSFVGDVAPDSSFDFSIPISTSLPQTWSKEEMQEFEVSWAVTARGSQRIFQLLKTCGDKEGGVIVSNTCSYAQALPSPSTCCHSGAACSMSRETMLGSSLQSGSPACQIQVKLECSCTRYASTSPSGSVYVYANFRPQKAFFAILNTVSWSCLSQAQVLSYLQLCLFHQCTLFSL